MQNHNKGVRNSITKKAYQQYILTCLYTLPFDLSVVATSTATDPFRIKYKESPGCPIKKMHKRFIHY